MTSRPLAINEKISLQVPVNKLWRFLYDTDRLNRALGLPTVSYVPDPDPTKKGHYAALAKLGPIRLRYEEFPFEWVENHYYRVKRRFQSGPFLEIVVGVRMGADGPGKSWLELFADVLPRHALGALFTKLFIRKMAISGVLSQVRAFEKGYIESANTRLPLKPPPGLGRAFEPRMSALAASQVFPELVPRLREVVKNGSDVEVGHIRPFELADTWKAPRPNVLRFMLHAAKAGIMDLNWEIVCPHCRAASASAPTLSGLSAQAACQTCETTFRADFSNSVEAVFSVNPAIRSAQREMFCIGAPARAPRIIAQLRLEPGERREEALAPEEGLLTARCYQAPGLRGLEATPEETNGKLTVACRPASFVVNEARVKAGPISVEVANELPKEALVVLERETWNDTAATAAAVATIQEFRDLFPEQAVAPGQEIRVGRMALLFTDLQGSTELYSKIGDVRAFDFVHGHFGFLITCLARHNGGLVKTIGDAVMAAFPSAREALQAGIDMQLGWPEFIRSQKVPSYVGLRVGLHEGPAVAFNNRGILDYFGTTVNLAARIQSKSESDQVVLAADVADSPDVADLLAATSRPLERFDAELKGITGTQKLARVMFERRA